MSGPVLVGAEGVPHSILRPALNENRRWLSAKNNLCFFSEGPVTDPTSTLLIDRLKRAVRVLFSDIVHASNLMLQSQNSAFGSTYIPLSLREGAGGRA